MKRSLQPARRSAATLLLLMIAGQAHAVVGLQASTSNLSPVAGGPAFSYTLTITNLDAVTQASSVALVDRLPGGVNFLSVAVTGTSAGFVSCDGPATGVNGSVICRAATLPASGVATVTITAQMREDAPAGPIVNTPRLVAGGTGNTANVDQTVVNNASVVETVASGISGNLGIRLISLNVPGVSAAFDVATGVALPGGAAFVSVDGTRGLADRCSYDPVTATVACAAPVLTNGQHQATVVFELLDGVFRDGFED